MLTPESAMNQASMTAMEYFAACYKYLDKAHPDVSEEVKMQCASRMTVAASIDYATGFLGGAVEGEFGVKVQMTGELHTFEQ